MAELYDRSKAAQPFKCERPPYVMENLHLLRTKRSGATFATA